MADYSQWHAPSCRYLLQFDLGTADDSVADPSQAGQCTGFSVTFSSTALPNAYSPPRSANMLGSQPDWATNYFSLDGLFDPSAPYNEVAAGYLGTGGNAPFGAPIKDYGHVRFLKITDTQTGIVWLGEYPVGQAYIEQDWSLGGQYQGLMQHYGVTGDAWFAGDGDFPPEQWNAQTKHYDTNPVDQNGVSSGICHWFFTVPKPPPPPLIDIAQARALVTFRAALPDPDGP